MPAPATVRWQEDGLARMSGGGFQLLDIILLGGVAGFLVLRLPWGLGKRPAPRERIAPRAPSRPRQQQNDQPAPDNDDSVVRFPGAEEPDATASLGKADLPKDATPLAKGIMAIREADRAFNPRDFVGGARAAFEMILQAYAKGDLKSLRPLLANEVFEEFAGAIKAREQAGESLETTLVGITAAEIAEAELQGKTAFVTVKFVSEQINVTRDAEGQAIDGADARVETITDLWTFARNTRSRDPNWTLVATDTPE